MSGGSTYQLPNGPLRLAGPVARPAPGTLPLRGDLAHVALAGTHLAAHYVIPSPAEVGSNGAKLHSLPREDSDVFTTLEPGTAIEVLDIAGAWVWGCLGPEGPSGYIKGDCLSPA